MFIEFKLEHMAIKSKYTLFKLLFAVLGALGGFLYWKFIGCASGTCPIQSVWYLSTLWGLTMGYLIGDLLGSLILKQGKKHDETV